MTNPLPPLKRQILALSSKDQRSLLNWLRHQIEDAGNESDEIPVFQNSQLVDTLHQVKITYQLEGVCCENPPANAIPGSYTVPTITAW